MRSHIPIIIITTLLFVLHAVTPAQASPFDNLIPRGVPNPFNHNDFGKEAQDFLRGQLGKALGEEAPFVLDPNQAFQQVPSGQAPTSDNFKPAALTTLYDLIRPLQPGDYSVKVMFYCTQWSVHRPGRGHPYTMGRAQGRLAVQMSALLFRGTIKRIAPARLNAMAWRIQAGVPLDQWSDNEKMLVHNLIPEYENDLGDDWLQRIESKYNHTFRLATRRSFNDELETLGDLGQLALNLKAAHQTLADQKVIPERLPDLMFQQFGAGGIPQLPDDADRPSPWMNVSPGIMARFTVQDGNLGTNLMELRTTQEASRDGTDPTLFAIVNGTGANKGRGLVGYNPNSQSPIITPTGLTGWTGSTPLEAVTNAMKALGGGTIEYGGWTIPYDGGYLAYQAGTGNANNFTPDPISTSLDPVNVWHTHPFGATSGSDSGDDDFANQNNIPVMTADPNGSILQDSPDPNYLPPPPKPNVGWNGPFGGTPTQPNYPVQIVGHWK